MTLPKTTAIANQKGGVAKTTTCLSLGASLAERGKSVLLVDLDPQAHLTLSLGLNPAGLRHTMRDVLLDGASLLDISRQTGVPLLSLAPANPRLSTLDRLLYGHSDYEYLLKSRLQALDAGTYDLIIMDCPPFLSTLVLNALTAADLLIIPTLCEYYASRSLRHVLELVQLVRRRTNPNLAYCVLITMFDRRNRISHLVRQQLTRLLSDALFKTVIEIDTKLRESPLYGQPVTSYAPRTRGAVQYRALAEELMNYGP